MTRSSLIEECYQLSTSALKRSIARCGNASGAVIDDQLTLLNGKNELIVNYWLELEGGEPIVTLGAPNREPQKISLLTLGTPFAGTRYYFECPDCLRRCDKLYLSPEAQEFKCQQHFTYGLTIINRQSPYGQYIYQLSRKAKVMDKREAINRIWYAGSYTRRYCSLLKMAARAGMVDYVKDTMKIWEEVQAIKAH